MCGSADGKLRQYVVDQAEMSQPLVTVVAHQDRICALEWRRRDSNPDVLLSASSDGCIKSWSIVGGGLQLVQSVDVGSDIYSVVAADKLLVGTFSKHVRKFDMSGSFIHKVSQAKQSANLEGVGKRWLATGWPSLMPSCYSSALRRSSKVDRSVGCVACELRRHIVHHTLQLLLPSPFSLLFSSDRPTNRPSDQPTNRPTDRLSGGLAVAAWLPLSGG